MAELTFVPVPYMPDNAGITGLLYLAWVAYPGLTESKQREAFINSAMAGALKSRGKHVPPYLRHIKRERILPKVNQGLARIDKRRILSLWALYKHIGVFKYWTDDLNISSACDALTQYDQRADYDASDGPDDFEAIWPNAESQASPEKNVRRNFYESVPAMAMTIGLPVFRVPATGSMTLPEMLQSHDWVLPACERANRAGELLNRMPLFDGKRLNIPKLHVPD
ncbi:hypothetical protein [Parasphingorhabdus sp.]|uniref:hypothetical protein n=1 Tax=Parasphingorhabdus sp. TaxID=2709688 RepID=UPI0032EEB05E